MRVSALHRPALRLRERLAVKRVHVSAAVGAVAIAVASVAGASAASAALLGWTAASLVFLFWVWASVAPKDASQAARAAATQDDRTSREAIVLVARRPAWLLYSSSWVKPAAPTTLDDR